MDDKSNHQTLPTTWRRMWWMAGSDVSRVPLRSTRPNPEGVCDSLHSMERAEG